METMAVATLMRPAHHKLGDFLFPPVLEKLQFGQGPEDLEAGIGNMNAVNANLKPNLASYLAGENFYYNSLPTTSSRVSNGNVVNENYAKVTLGSEQKEENIDNAKFYSSTKSPPLSKKDRKDKRKKKYGNKNVQKPKHITAEDVEMEEESEGDKLKALSLQQEIAREQEYQAAINAIYNSPALLGRHAASLRHEPAQLHGAESQPWAEAALQHCPPMYYVPLQLQWPVQQHTTRTTTAATAVFQPLTTSTPTAMLLEAASSSSDYFSDSASSGGWSSDDEAADRSSSCSLEPASCDASYASYLPAAEGGDREEDAALELDEELNNLVLSIIGD